MSKPQLLYTKMNYILMAVGVVIIIIGFMLMAGGGAELGPDGYAHEFDKAGLYSFRRITLAPIVIMLGFILEVFAIMKNFNKADA